MKKLMFLVLISLIASQLSQSHSSSPPNGSTSVGFFYSKLTPYGEWIEIEAGYHAWRPHRVARGWRPYFHGRWAWTDHGWYWVSSEPFGWAVYHYGRWFNDDFYGWIWIPDHVWGPAWVEWRYGDDYVGWAPLPPYAHFSISVGIRFTTRWAAPWSYWSFTHCRHFGAPEISRHIVDGPYTRRLIRTSRSTGSYEIERDRVINRGVDRRYIESRGNTRINPTDISETRERSVERLLRDSGRDRIEVYRPGRTEMDEQKKTRIDARRAERRTTLDFGRIEQRDREPRQDQIERRGESEPRREQRKPVDPRIRDRREQPTPEKRQEPRVEERRETRPQNEFRPAMQRGQGEIKRENPKKFERPQFPTPRMERQPSPPTQDRRGSNQPRREERPRSRG